MFAAELLCSDEACAVVVEAVGELAELELLVCEDCGCTLQIASVWETHELRVRPPVEELPLAA